MSTPTVRPQEYTTAKLVAHLFALMGKSASLRRRHRVGRCPMCQHISALGREVLSKSRRHLS